MRRCRTTWDTMVGSGEFSTNSHACNMVIMVFLGSSASCTPHSTRDMWIDNRFLGMYLTIVMLKSLFLAHPQWSNGLYNFVL